MKSLKKFLTLLLFVLPILMVSACQIQIPNGPTNNPGGQVTPHVHNFVDGKCSCGEVEGTEHTHNFVNGECSCGLKDPDFVAPLTDMITIRSLQAEVNNEPVQEEKSKVRKMSMRMNSPILFEDEVLNEGTVNVPESNAQYIVMYRSETDIKFTITLNNPKGMAIDAVELTCDDPNSQIMMDGVYEDIQMSAEKSVIVNWSQENPYKKTYNIRTTSEEFINTLRVVDIKVNGEWQGEALEKDELIIYKIANDDLKWNFITNTPDYYKWTFTFNEELIQNLIVKVDGELLEADEEGVYTVEKNCNVTWEYDVVVNGVGVKWNGKKDIELFWIEYPIEGESRAGYMMSVMGSDMPGYDDCYEIRMFKFHGTDVTYNDERYSIVINETIISEKLQFKLWDPEIPEWFGVLIYVNNDNFESDLYKADLYLNEIHLATFLYNWEWPSYGK